MEIQLRMREFPQIGIIDIVGGHSSAESMQGILYAPLSVLRAIYDALGFYPETEQLVYPQKPKFIKPGTSVSI